MARFQMDQVIGYEDDNGMLCKDCMDWEDPDLD